VETPKPFPCWRIPTEEMTSGSTWRHIVAFEMYRKNNGLLQESYKNKGRESVQIFTYNMFFAK